MTNYDTIFTMVGAIKTFETTTTFDFYCFLHDQRDDQSSRPNNFHKVTSFVDGKVTVSNKTVSQSSKSRTSGRSLKKC